MSSRDRVRQAVEHQRTDRVPLDMWYTPETAQKLKAHLGVSSESELREALGLDMVWLWADFNGPARTVEGPGTCVSPWGFASKEAEYDGGKYFELVYHPLAGTDSIQQVDDFQWLNPDDYDFDGMRAKILDADAHGEKWIGVGESAIFERSWALVGMEEFLAMMIALPDVASRIMERVNDIYLRQTLNTLAACEGRADMVYIADDIGSQLGMMMDPGMWREMIKPLQKRFNDAIRSEYPGIVFHYHSCGSIVPVIDDLIEIGVDILNPIQPKAAGMDPEFLAEKFGDRLSFLGGLDTQELLPRASSQEVYDECVRLIKTLGKSGGYVLAPAHAVQVDVPVENILAIRQAAIDTPVP